MDTPFFEGAGLDGHLKGVRVAVRRRRESGTLAERVRSSGAITEDLRAPADDPQARGGTHAGREATGVPWEPVGDVPGGRLTPVLVNPRHPRKVPGRKADVTDAEWLARRLPCGPLRGRFVPPRPAREPRDRTRLRAQLVGEHTRAANRRPKVLGTPTPSRGRWPRTSWASRAGGCSGPCRAARTTRTC
jgi:transposase